MLFLHTVLGTTLVAGGTSALNQVVERDLDSRMKRTARRPIPSGRLDVSAARVFAATLTVGGVLYLAFLVNLLTAMFAALTVISYVFVYTPLKKVSSLSTLVGAVPGALPIVGGWTAAGAPLGAAVWSLFWVLFLWQLPHFLALAWMYREDYAKAGLRMLSVGDESGITFRQAMLYAVALLPTSLAPYVLGVTGRLYFMGALLLSGWYVYAGVRVARRPTNSNVRRLFGASILYLPLLLLLLVLGRIV